MTDPASTGNDTWRFDDLRALYVNCTLKRSPEPSHTQGLIDKSRAIMERHGVAVDELRAVDHDIATGVWPDMTEHGWATDEWPQIHRRVLAADILVLAGPIWLGDNSSVMKQVIERLYSCSHLLNEAGQYAYYGRVGGCLITGNEDGVKHCAMNVLYSLQHLGYTIPPQADAGWIGAAGPGPSYLDPGSGGPDNDFTNRNTAFMTWNLLHLARIVKEAGGIPAHGNQRSEWEAGCRFDFDNPDYRQGAAGEGLGGLARGLRRPVVLAQRAAAPGPRAPVARAGRRPGWPGAAGQPVRRSGPRRAGRAAGASPRPGRDRGAGRVRAWTCGTCSRYR